MKIIPNKSKALSFTRARVKEPLNYSLGDQKIPEGSCCKYLGIIKRSDLNTFVTVAPHRWCPYFDVVVGLVWSNDPESCPGCSDAIGMASRARQVKGDDPDKKGYPGPPGWGLVVRLTVSHRKTYIC